MTSPSGQCCPYCRWTEYAVYPEARVRRLNAHIEKKHPGKPLIEREASRR